VVTVDYPVDLRLVAECVDAPVTELEELNPSLLRGTTPKGQKFELRVPEGTKEKYHTAIAAIPKDKRVLWRYHKVEPGETLVTIAKKYHTTERSISQANGLDSTDLERDARLVIPVNGPIPGEHKVSYSKRATRYKVHTGDTVLTVAEDFGVPPEKVRSWNRLKGNQLHFGKVLLIYKPVDSTDPSPSGAKHHKKKSTTKHVAKTASKSQPAKTRKPGTALTAGNR